MLTTRSSLVRRMSRATALALVLALTLGMWASTALARASVDRLDEPFVTVVPVAYADNPAGVELMFAECDRLQRVEKPDGTSVETQTCQLTQPFFDFPGTPPSEAFTNRAGPCIWYSDYYSQTTGADVWAESVRLTVTPSGNVSVKTTYTAEPLDC